MSPHEYLDVLLEHKDSYDYFYLVLEPFTNGRALRQNQKIISPLRARERTASFCIYRNTKIRDERNQWRYKDFGTDDEYGTFLDLAVKVYGVSYEEATKILLGMIDAPMPKIPERIKRPVNGVHEIVPRAWDDWKDEAYWGDYGITIGILNQYGVKPVYAVISNYEGDVVTEIMDEPAYLYDVGGNKKIYRPKNGRKKFRYLGKGDADYVFGYEQLTDGGVIFTGGEKDVMCLRSMGYNAICLNSETAMPSEELVSDLKNRFGKSIFVLYDSDKTGRAQSEKMHTEFGLLEFRLPDVGGWGKDVSDYWKYFKEDPLPKLPNVIFSN